MGRTKRDIVPDTVFTLAQLRNLPQTHLSRIGQGARPSKPKRTRRPTMLMQITTQTASVLR